MDIRDLADLVDGKGPNRDGWYECKCPAHQDRKRSLGLKQGTSGTIITKCHAGCERRDILCELGNLYGDHTWYEFQRGEEVDDYKPPASTRTQVAEYMYRDASGRIIYRVVRYSDKSFKQQAYDMEKGGWKDRLGDTPRQLYMLPELLHGISAGKTVWYCEGEKDVHTLISHGLCATTHCGGSGSWKAEYAQNLRGANVVILPDADKPGRAMVDKMHPDLQRVCKSVRVVQLYDDNSGRDVSDWITEGHTADELARLAEKTTPAGKKPPIMDLVTRFLTEHHIYSHYDSIFHYQGGCYRRQSEHDLRVLIDPWLYRHLGSRYNPQRDRSNFVSGLIGETAITPKQLEERDNSRLINCSNKLLNIDTLEATDHTEKHLGYIQINAAWDPDAACPDPDRLLSELLKGQPDDAAAVMEYFGSCLAPWGNWQKFPVFLGKGRNGKSTLLDIWRCVLGTQNVSSIPLQRLGDRFQSYALIGKLANIYEELPSIPVGNSSVAKIISGGGVVDVEKKYGSTEAHRLTCKFLFSANEMPNCADKTDGFYRRIHQIQFNQQFPEGNYSDFRQLYITEQSRSRWLRLAVEALRRLMKQGSYTQSQESISAIESTRRDQDSIFAFKQDCIEEIDDPESDLLNDDVYELYIRYCESGSMVPRPRDAFFPGLRGLVKCHSKRESRGGKRDQYMYGIRLTAHLAEFTDVNSKFSKSHRSGF